MSRRLVLLIALLLGAALVSGGCGADEIADQATEQTLEEQLEDATGDDVDIDIDDDKVTVETSDGTFEAGTGELPADYPADKVPVVGGTVLYAVSDGDGGFSVAVQYDGSADDAYADAEQALTGAGLSASDVIDTLEGSNSGAFEGNGYDVLVSVIDSAGEPAVNYVVTTQR